MSGGVDSSVAAAMLLEQGFEVVGVTMHLFGEAMDRLEGSCGSFEAIEDAQRVAHELGIAHYALPMQEVFKKSVIDDFIDEYKQGHTPNPCIRCNRLIKFGALLDWAKTVGADRIATGHYARVQKDSETGRCLLLRSADRSRDQSYALYSLSQEQLSRTLFPLGEICDKAATRGYAEKLGLTIADKPDSQEICFVADNDYRAFLRLTAPELVERGSIVDTTGRVLGQHDGIAFFTVGQRKHLGIAVGKPQYVIKVDKRTNTVVVGDDSEVYKDRLIAKNIKLISVGEIDAELVVTAKIRYNTNDSAAIVRPLFKDVAEVVFEQPQRAITPGQAVVFYDEEILIGGGTIADAYEFDVT